MLSLECKHWLFEVFAIEMCTQGMEWNLLYVLQISKPHTFQELTTKVHDIEEMLANSRSNSFGFANSKKDKVEFRRNVNFSTTQLWR